MKCPMSVKIFQCTIFWNFTATCCVWCMHPPSLNRGFNYFRPKGGRGVHHMHMTLFPPMENHLNIFFLFPHWIFRTYNVRSGQTFTNFINWKLTLFNHLIIKFCPHLNQKLKLYIFKNVMMKTIEAWSIWVLEKLREF